MHLKRWITSIAILPFLVLLICKGGSFLFAVFIGIICILALREYFCIVFSKDRSMKIENRSSKDKIFQLSPSIFHLLSFIIGPMIIWAAYSNSFDIIICLIVLNLIVSGLISLRQFKHNSSMPEIVAKQVLGIIYIPLFLSCLIMIRGRLDDGILWIFLLLSIIFAGDIGAYYIGSYFGRHKLCPAISPGKTIEGSIGGLVANLGTGALLKYFFFPLLPWGVSILFFLLIGIVGQVGDLFESELKRAANVKDSGVILPGHGGVLDRIDALLFAAPVAFFFKEYIILC